MIRNCSGNINPNYTIFEFIFVNQINLKNSINDLNNDDFNDSKDIPNCIKEFEFLRIFLSFY